MQNSKIILWKIFNSRVGWRIDQLRYLESWRPRCAWPYRSLRKENFVRFYRKWSVRYACYSTENSASAKLRSAHCRYLLTCSSTFASTLTIAPSFSFAGRTKSAKHLKRWVSTWSPAISARTSSITGGSSVCKGSVVSVSLTLSFDDEDGSYESLEVTWLRSLSLPTPEYLATLMSIDMEQHTQRDSQRCDICFRFDGVFSYRHIQ